MQRTDDVAHLGPRQGIEYVFSLTPGLHQPVGAQAGELLEIAADAVSSISSISPTDFSPSISRQRIKSRPSWAKALRNPLASCALPIIASMSMIFARGGGAQLHGSCLAFDISRIKHLYRDGMRTRAPESPSEVQIDPAEPPTRPSP